MKNKIHDIKYSILYNYKSALEAIVSNAFFHILIMHNLFTSFFFIQTNILLSIVINYYY